MCDDVTSNSVADYTCALGCVENVWGSVMFKDSGGGSCILNHALLGVPDVKHL